MYMLYMHTYKSVASRGVSIRGIACVGDRHSQTAITTYHHHHAPVLCFYFFLFLLSATHCTLAIQNLYIHISGMVEFRTYVQYKCRTTRNIRYSMVWFIRGTQICILNNFIYISVTTSITSLFSVSSSSLWEFFFFFFNVVFLFNISPIKLCFYFMFLYILKLSTRLSYKDLV